MCVEVCACGGVCVEVCVEVCVCHVASKVVCVCVCVNRTNRKQNTTYIHIMWEMTIARFTLGRFFG